MTAPIDYKAPRAWLTMAAFVIVVVAVGGLIGSQSVPGAWYESLTKPPFNPPSWIFGPVWSTLYVLIGIAGARIWMLARSSAAMKLWVGQMIFNWIWSPVWFIGQMLWPAFAIIMIILALIIAFIVAARRHDALSAWLFVPYMAWVAFASVLNLSIAILN